MNNIVDTHPYYEEIFEFSSMVVANMSLLQHAAATKTIRDLGEFVKTMIETRNTDVKISVNDHPMVKCLPLGSTGSNEEVILHNTDILFAYLAGLNQEKPSEIVYSIETKEEKKEGDKQNSEENKTHWEGADPTRRFELLAGYIIGGSYERYKSHFETKYGNDPSKWHPELQFFRHLRNGCFHSNIFNIIPYKGNPKIDPTNPPTWKHYIMTSDSNMNGKKVLGGFFHLPQIIPFLDSMKAYV